MKKITLLIILSFLIGIGLTINAQTPAERAQFYKDFKNAVDKKTAIIKADPALYQKAINSGWFQKVAIGLENAEDFANGIIGNNGGPLNPMNNGLCADATPFCTSSGSTYPAGVNTGTAESGPNYGCLGTQPNPAWFYMKILTGGDLHITETNSNNIDVDFILWGPFTSPTCGASLSAGKIIDCSYSPVATEYIDIGSCIAGEYYMLLITNFSNNTTDITLAKTSGSAETDCAITQLPLPPVASAATGITTTSFDANWAAASGDPYPATSFVLDVSTDPGFGSFFGGFNNFNVGNVTTYPVTGLSPGATYYYRLRGVNANGQSSNSNVITVTTLSLVATAGVLANVSCYGQSNGSADVTVSGGTSPFTFAWSTNPVQTTQSATGLTAGTYTVTVTDATPITATSNTTVTQPDVLSAIAGVLSNVSCYGGSDGSVNVTVSGGTPSYTFTWSTSPVQTTQSATGLTAGTYSVTVTDHNGCSATSSATVTQPAQWWPGLTGPVNVCQYSTGNIYTTESGMSNYIWVVSAGGTITAGGTTSSNSVTVTWNTTGAQSVSVKYTNLSGCTAVDPTILNVTVYAYPTPVISGDTAVTVGQLVNYSTPYVPGHSYVWIVNSGYLGICYPNQNCCTVTWIRTCYDVPPFIRVTETVDAAGCSTTVTKWITITP